MEVIIRPEGSYWVASKNVELLFRLGNAGGTFGLNRTGQIMWDGALNLSEVIEHNPPRSLFNCRVLELGCGCCSLPGQVAATLGALVTVTDVRDEIDSITENIKRNSKAHVHPICITELDWACVQLEHSFPPNLIPTEFDLVLCADLVYEHTLVPLMFTLLLLLFHNPHISILMSNTNRKHVHLFRKRMTKFCHFDIVQCPSQTVQNQLVWLIRLNEEPNWEQVWASFSM
jgi:predicted nicotinamide N-methyase